MTLHEMRNKKGYSQNDLATKSGVKLRTIQSYEAGSRDINGAGLDVLCELALALDCQLTQVLTDEQLIKKVKLINKVAGKNESDN